MKRFSNILLVADANTDCSVALDRAARLARNNQATLTVVSVIEVVFAEHTVDALAAKFRDTVLSEQREKLDNMVELITQADMTVKTKVLIGKPFIEIIRQVLQFEHDLIIKCADEALSLGHMLFGSTDMHLMRKSPCPVWIIKATEQPQFGRILAALDHDPEDAVTDVLNRQILEMSTSLALSEFSELHIVHAWRLACESFMRSPRMNPTHVDVDAMVAEKAEERRSWLEGVAAAHGAKTDKDAMDYLDPHLHVIKGSATHVIPTTARELGVDLVIMGTVGRSGVPGLFMGSTAESILTQLDCSVLTIKPPGFATPVRP